MSVDEFGRHEPDFANSPLVMVAQYHRFLRETLFWKCAGLTEEQLRWSPVPSGTCLLGILKHSLNVERWWILTVIGDLKDVESDSSEEDPDGDWRIEVGETFATIKAKFEAEALRSEQVLASKNWDDLCHDTRARMSGVTVGWVMTHMVEEVGRHCGQADLIRELIDGQTGE